MKLRTIIKSTLVTLVAATVVLAGAGRANAIPYVPGEDLNAPSTPAFNIYTGVPNAIGDEPDFVRLRKSNGDPTTNAQNAPFSDPLNTACNVGEMVDVRTYVHNGANEEFNDNGNGSAVAHGVRVAMQAPLNQPGKNFRFTSTISATNAASVTDSAMLNCGSANNVKLELVPQTVKVYALPLGWNGAPDSAVNGSLPIGSRQVGSGDVWGCFEDRVVVVYTVVVKEVPVTPTPTPTPVTPVTPKALPNTGAGEVVGMAVAVGIAGTLAYRFIWLRRYEV